MTISNQDARTGPYNGNGSTTEFAYDFKLIDASHLVVTLKNAANVETVQTIVTQYTVSGVGDAGGGTVTMVTPPASGETLTLSRAVPRTQEVDLVNRGGVQPEVLETAYDKLTQQVQDQAELFARIPRFPVSSSLSDVELPLTLTANAVLKVNSAGTAFENGPTSDQVASAQAYATAAEAALDAFTDLYLGAKASDPTLDNDGNALQDGALYFDTTLNVMKVYDLGTTTWKRTTPTTGDQANIDAVTANATNINAVAGNATNINTVAGVAANVTTVAGVAANVTTVAGISSDVTVAATNVVDITNFADVYVGPSASDPTQRADTSALQAGDLYFNTALNVMKVYNGASWQDAAVSSAAVVSKTSNTGAAVLPSGTTAQRDGSPAAGYLRFNSTDTAFEGFDGSAWGAIGGGGPALDGGGTGEESVIRLNKNQISGNVALTISTGDNGMSAGPITITTGSSVTVSTGATWHIIGT